ncbi:hypothetical protein RHGRI_000367 [Rhododendron griersonianum]|uniref:Uncharacterized protein n=1 Tax=Rhododendron griersonianum TaxID=479676 RepID=A0AAV6LHA9_9ERIC|nr:hypothetical protein RHGRI_000367 [Rhododendron griersonianum]
MEGRLHTNSLIEEQKTSHIYQFIDFQHNVVWKKNNQMERRRLPGAYFLGCRLKSEFHQGWTSCKFHS